jgi:hypothetical protein
MLDDCDYAHSEGKALRATLANLLTSSTVRNFIASSLPLHAAPNTMISVL